MIAATSEVSWRLQIVRVINFLYCYYHLYTHFDQVRSLCLARIILVDFSYFLSSVMTLCSAPFGSLHI